jgi:RHS repeat-associated protein
MTNLSSLRIGRALLAALAFGFAATSAALAADGTRYYVNDHLATTVGIADAAGEIAALEADAFGSPLAGGANAGRFTGKPYDEDLGAYVFPFRNYRADEARWMSADPSGFPDGLNKRIYAARSFREIDPLGLVINVYGNESAYNEAKSYATSTTSGAALWNQLETSTKEYSIDAVGGSESKFTHGNGDNGGAIRWDPEMGVKDKAGNAISPATVLLHEIAHAAGYDSDHQAYIDRLNSPPDPVWGNEEDKRVIQNIENPFALEKGEGVRSSWTGSSFKASGVTSNKE